MKHRPATERTPAADLDTLWRFSGTPNEFWSACLASGAALIDADAGFIMARGVGQSEWRKVAPWPSLEAVQPLAELDAAAADACVRNGSAFRRLTRTPGESPGRAALAVRLFTTDEQECVAVFLVPADAEAERDEWVARLSAITHAPAAYQERRLLQQARADVASFSSVLDLMTCVGPEKRFVAMAMTVCNELAGRHRCEQVSLGWLDPDGYVHMQAISHTERFERKMEAVKQIEYAMEEAIDQDDELVWPAPPDAASVTREQQNAAASRGIAHLCTVPLRFEGRPVAALTCERQAAPFDETDLRLLRLSCDLVTPRLVDLKRRDRWIGARLGVWVRESLSRLVGVQHTWAKVAGLLVALCLGVILFGRMTYRVEGNFILKAEHAITIPALFDGYIAEVPVDVGDAVQAGQDLLLLDTRELLLEEASAAADYQRFVREAEKARADQKLADMQIALALSEQARARLDLIQQRIARSRIQAPFDGIVIDGDLRERIGAPVRLGDPLFRIARIENLYVDLEIEEAQIHEIELGMDGRIALVSQPGLKFPIQVVRIEPVAVPKERRNVFLVRCELVGDHEDWWRPGMSGVGKVEVGRRNIFWIYTRPTADFLRLRFWW